MSEKVKTPEYWKDEFFQPLVKAKTFNGNEVMIPESSRGEWHCIEIQSDTILDAIPLEKMFPDISPERMSFRRITSRDVRKVFFEVWKENLPIETQIVEYYLESLKKDSKTPY